ncbi:MAG: DUF5682 family protein [Chloroflexota bacterium]|nr:DUF5682 family protein [Chloroflexota bacterium]
MSISVFGVRHHGPGCARSLRAALERLEPDIVLVEGPPDAQGVLSLIAHEEMQPPVALLIYAPDEPKRAAYYPFTHFSPEWQALRYAVQHGIPARFMDLPQAVQMARDPAQELLAALPPAQPDGETPATHGDDTLSQAETTLDAPPVEPVPALEEDPLAMLARAAGYADNELWWEQQIEQRRDVDNLFEGILEAMTELRADKTPKNREEAQREAHMRQTIRAALREGFQRIAVVCGAWHAPVLIEPGPAKADAALLSGLRRVKVEATWIPWTNSRLSYRSGYGAGVTSPGWYEHLWTAPDRITIRWITRAAHLLRTQGLDASSASIIEAVRLSESLAALRDLPMPGLAEQHEAIETVLCNGNAAPMSLIRNQLEIGEKLGEVPTEAPAVPLQRDLEAKQRRLRLKPSAEITTLDLDLRKETDRERSQLLHRLRLLSIEWGELQPTRGKAGTFHEVWQVQWRPEFAVAVIEANIWGNTVEVAATAFVRQQANHVQDLPQLSKLLDSTILAELPEAVETLLQEIQKRAAVSSDVRHLMDALPPLTRVARYGDVRQTSAERILPVIDGLFERVLIGLPGACASLDDDAAQQMLGSIDNVQESVSLLDRMNQRAEWQACLHRLMETEALHGLIRGRCCRLLLEQKVLDDAELQRLTGLALSTANPAPQAAAWIEGVLRGSALTVLHQDGLWHALDAWLSDLNGETFEALLPILRRAFSDFQPAERRKMGEKVKHLTAAPGTQGHLGIADKETRQINQERAVAVLPVLAQILGVTSDEKR